MSYKIQIEQLHLYNKKHVLIGAAMDIGRYADKEVSQLKKEIDFANEKIADLQNEARKIMILLENKKHYDDEIRKLTSK